LRSTFALWEGAVVSITKGALGDSAGATGAAIAAIEALVRKAKIRE
jgi:Na+/glutamate symporter